MVFALADYAGRPCNAGTAFEFIPNKTNPELSEAKRALVDAGIPLEVISPIVLVFRFDETELSWYKSGKLLVKGSPDEKQATELVNRLFESLNRPRSGKD